MPVGSHPSPCGSANGAVERFRPGSGKKTTNAGFWKRLLKRFALVALVAGALALLIFVLSVIGNTRNANWDFNGFYAAGKIVLAGTARNLYSLPLQRQVELRFVSSGRFLPFDHPPFEAWLFTPLALTPYRVAFVLWSVLNLIVLIPSLYLLQSTGYRLDTVGLLVWLACSIPLIAGTLLLGQDLLLLVPVFLLAFLALKRRREVAAGLVLGIGLFRFEIMLPLVLIFLLRRRWKVLAGFSVTAAVALIASLALVGWGGLVDYSHLLLKVGRPSGSQANGVATAAMPSFRGAMATLLGGVLPSEALFAIVLVGTFLVLFWAAWQFRHGSDPENPSFDLEFSLATLAALLASYHLFVHELTPLIVVGFLMLGHEGRSRKAGLSRGSAGTAFLLLFAIVFLVAGAGFGFRDFSVLFIVLLAMMVWLTQEIAAGHREQITRLLSTRDRS